MFYPLTASPRAGVVGLPGSVVREAVGHGYAVATEESLATSLAVWALERGGNAVDAAVAASLGLALTIPHLGGLGGDFLALVREPDGSVWVVNGYGQAPQGLTRALLLEKGYRRVPYRGPLSITVPGAVGGLYAMWRRGGRLEWRSLLQEAAGLARRGVPAPPSLVRALQAYRGLLEEDPGSRETYLSSPPLSPGDPLRLPGLARLLEDLAGDPQALYRGEHARAVEDYVAERGGVLKAGDMAGYEPIVTEPLATEYRGWRLYEMPPNTQGATTLHLMKVLEEWRLPRDPGARVYYMIAASAPAYRFRDRELGDPRYMRVPVEGLLDPGILEDLRAEARRGPPECTDTRLHSIDGDTTFFAIADGEGRVVAGIQSLFMPWGSTLTVPSLNLTLHGRASGFTMEPGLPNTVAPGKRPLHTLSAVIAEAPDGRILALGQSGGHYRPQQHALMLTSIIDHGMGPGEAIAAPRPLWAPWTCRVVVDEGHQPLLPPGYYPVAGRTGVANAVVVDGSVRWAATDPRGDGYPVVGH